VPVDIFFTEESTMSIVLPGFFFSILALIFIALKLAGDISWSWWLVLLPVAWPFYMLALFAIGGMLVMVWENITVLRLALLALGLAVAEFLL
jgi:hypothetical protein